MKNKELTYGLTGLLLGAGIVWLTSVSIVNNNQTGMMNMMGIRQPQQRTIENQNILDAHFIEQMVPHHEDAITMSKIALQKAVTNNVKTLAQNIIDSQSKEIEEMKEWYQEWYGRELPTGSQVMQHHGMGSGSGMHMGIMGDATDTEKLANAPDFDREFLEQMIPHHQMAVMMASMLKNGTSRPEMRQLADDIITAQTQEIEKMRTWLNE